MKDRFAYLQKKEPSRNTSNQIAYYAGLRIEKPVVWHAGRKSEEQCLTIRRSIRI